MVTVDDRNTQTWWRRHPGSAWVSHGDYETLFLLCLGFLYKYLLSNNNFVRNLEGMMVIYVYPNFNSQVGLLICHEFCMVHCFLEILLVGRWDQPTHAQPDRFAAPQWYGINFPYWDLLGPSIPNRDIRHIGDTPVCTNPYIKQNPSWW